MLMSAVFMLRSSSWLAAVAWATRHTEGQPGPSVWNGSLAPPVAPVRQLPAPCSLHCKGQALLWSFSAPHKRAACGSVYMPYRKRAEMAPQRASAGPACMQGCSASRTLCSG